ncbi:MAG: hypothetical protein ACLU38_07655 [Dysosmobacter sp.]
MPDPYTGVAGYPALCNTQAHAVFCSHGHFDHHATDCVELLPERESPFTVREVETFHDDRGGALRGTNTVRIFPAGGLARRPIWAIWGTSRRWSRQRPSARWTPEAGAGRGRLHSGCRRERNAVCVSMPQPRCVKLGRATTTRPDRRRGGGQRGARSGAVVRRRRSTIFAGRRLS